MEREGVAIRIGIDMEKGHETSFLSLRTMLLSVPVSSGDVTEVWQFLFERAAIQMREDREDLSRLCPCDMS